MWIVLVDQKEALTFHNTFSKVHTLVRRSHGFMPVKFQNVNEDINLMIESGNFRF